MFFSRGMNERKENREFVVFASKRPWISDDFHSFNLFQKQQTNNNNFDLEHGAIFASFFWKHFFANFPRCNKQSWYLSDFIVVFQRKKSIKGKQQIRYLWKGHICEPGILLPHHHQCHHHLYFENNNPNLTEEIIQKEIIMTTIWNNELMMYGKNDESEEREKCRSIFFLEQQQTGNNNNIEKNEKKQVFSNESKKEKTSSSKKDIIIIIIITMMVAQ